MNPKYAKQYGSGNISQFELLKGLPFYDFATTDKSTFNHAIGFPQKNGQPMPLFDYKQLITTNYRIISTYG
jgi:hypothetical protein